MITKFDSLYAGHTDLENCGYEGTPINARRYTNEHLASSLAKAEAKAKMMEANGSTRSGWPSTISSARERNASPMFS